MLRCGEYPGSGLSPVQQGKREAQDWHIDHIYKVRKLAKFVWPSRRVFIDAYSIRRTSGPGVSCATSGTSDGEVLRGHGISEVP